MPKTDSSQYATNSTIKVHKNKNGNMWTGGHFSGIRNVEKVGDASGRGRIAMAMARTFRRASAPAGLAAH